jgi:hypothetical protein
MKLKFLGPLYARPGPYACVYLDTSRDIEDPDRAIELRRHHLRESLAAQGADIATTGAVAHVTGTDHDISGRHGQAVFAAHGRLAITEELPEPPHRDSARLTTVPDAMPLALQHFPDIPYVAAVVRRVPPSEESPEVRLDIDLESGRWPVSRVNPGKHLRRREAADTWRQTAAQVAEELAELPEAHEAEAVVLSGDHWARNVLARELPKRLRRQLVGVDSGHPGPLPGRALLEEELAELFRGRMSVRDEMNVERFLSRRARGGGVAEGLEPTVAALRRGQAEAVLVHDPPAPELRRPLWVGVAPKQIAVREEELRSFGVDSRWEEPADAALLRAMVGTGAELVQVPRAEVSLRDGIGALLRFTDGTV